MGLWIVVVGALLLCRHAALVGATGISESNNDQDPNELTNWVLGDMMARRDHMRTLSSWNGGRLRHKISAGYSKSSKGKRRNVPKYGRRHYDPYLYHNDDHYQKDHSLEYDDSADDDEIEGVSCISLANKKYRKDKKSSKGKKYHHYKHRKSGTKKGNKYKHKSLHHGSKSKSRSKSKSKSRKEYFDYCEGEEPVEEIVCSANVEDFRSSVGLIFSGNPQFLTGPEQIALENSFQETYNGLTFANCDGYFRGIESVALFVPGERRGRRRLEDTEDDSSSPPTNSSFAMVTGTCRACPVTSTGTFSLFDDSFRRRRRLQQSTADFIGSTDDLVASDVCTCPEQGAGRTLQLRQEDLEPNAPSEEEFVFAYNADIERLVEEGTVTNVGRVVALEEVPLDEEVQVTCNSNIEDFLTYVLVEFDGDATALSGMENAILSILFEQVYNDLSFANCDGYFRMTDDTLLVVPQGTDPAFFQVAATCRDCPVNNNGWFSIFANMRRSLHFLEMLPRTRDHPEPSRTSGTPVKTNPSRVRGLQMQMSRFPDEDVCFCPALSDNVDDPSPAAPSMNALRAELNRRISDLRRAGMINNIFSITSLSETPTSPAPEDDEDMDTAMPTVTPGDDGTMNPPETATPTTGGATTETPQTLPPSIQQTAAQTIPPSMMLPKGTIPPSMERPPKDTIPPSALADIGLTPTVMTGFKPAAIFGEDPETLDPDLLMEATMIPGGRTAGIDAITRTTSGTPVAAAPNPTKIPTLEPTWLGDDDDFEDTELPTLAPRARNRGRQQRDGTRRQQDSNRGRERARIRRLRGGRRNQKPRNFSIKDNPRK
ncbi:expressed unknown protein [Seminavis robusta]|uniref:Uncharacterized protein n=1 Tax=Seminavis robusta TaxID=568900 RepID=A0A9N8DIW2_9STRA|nr:expressed unknown protein [Seminavis robusta]|eukprot:Sro112_g055650.1 n/a (826) ;mRNA; f:52896-55604